MTKDQGTSLGNICRILPLGAFSLGCLLKSLWCFEVLLGEVSSSASPSAFSTAHSVPGKVTRGTSGKKGNIVVIVIGRGGGSGNNRQVIVFTWLLAPSPVHVIPSCAPAQYCYTGSFRQHWDPAEKLPIPRASLSS